MSIIFTKIKTPALPKLSARLSKLNLGSKISSVSLAKPKIPSGKTLKSFDFSKITKAPKLPKAPKIAILKKAIKKSKNVGY